jgi:hypothetical protein
VTLVRSAILLVVATLVAAGLPPSARAQEAGIIDGQLVNGTAGGAVPAGLEVIVHVLQNRAKTDERRVRADADGRFRVDGLATGPDMLYFPIVEYQGVPYFPDRPVVFDGPGPVHVDISVFEPTPTPDAVSFERLNMLILDVSPSALMVMEMGAVVNGGDRTFAADPQATGSARTLRFSLPPGALQITPQAGLVSDALESTPDGFATTDPVRPGRREIAFSYQLPYDSSALDLTRTFALPVGVFTLYVPDGVADVVGPGMALQGTADLGGRRFRQYAVQGLAPRAAVRFRLTGLPAPLFARPGQLGLVVAGASGLILLGAVLLALRRGRRRVPAGRAAESAPPTDLAAESASPANLRPASAERLALVRAVAQLDEQFAAGRLDEATYQAERQAQKARLVALARASADAR